MKLFCLSSSAFADNQMIILKHLAKDFEITYAVIIPYTNSNYTNEELSIFCSANSICFLPIELIYRYRDPRLLVSFFSIITRIRKAKPDIIYVTNFDQLYLNILLLMIDTSKTIIALHDVESHSNTPFSNIAKLSKTILIHNFKYFHTFSIIQENLLRKIAPKKEIFTIPLPLIDFGPLNKTLKDKNVIEFLFFGFILYYKGVDLLITAFNNIAENYPNVRLTIAGRCKNWEEKYAQLVEKSTQVISHIRFIKNDEIPNYFSTADYVVLPYRDTTQCGPLMISYNYNIPVLVSAAEGFKEFTSEGVTGYSFDMSIKGDLERLLVACVDRPKQEYEELKKRLTAYTELNFSKKSILYRYKQLFENVLSS